MVLRALEATYGQARAAEARDAAPASVLRLLPTIGASLLPEADPVPPLASGVVGQDLPFVGRGVAFERLVAAYEQARAGEARVVVIEGEAGIGKTRLTEEFLRWAAAQGADVLCGAAIEPQGWPLYQVVVDALRPRLARDRASEDLLPDMWIIELVRLFPELRERYPDLPVAAVSADDGTGRGRLHEAVAQLTLALAERARPGALVMVVDDAQWADQASLDLLRHLARVPAARPLLLVVTYCGDDLDRHHPLTTLIPLLVREARTERLALRPLDAIAARALVRVRYDLPEREAARLAAYLLARTEGNALFLTELLRALEEEGRVCPKGEHWTLGNLADTPVPLLLRQVVDARLARLGDAEGTLLAAAAVVGQEVPLVVWQAAAGAGDDALEVALERAEAAHLVKAWPGGDGMGFTHALIREVLYEAISAPRRRRLHRQVAEALIAHAAPDPDAVAYHLQRSGDKRAAVWLARAGERAEDAHAHEIAAERYEAAFTLLDAQQGDPTERGWLRLLVAALRIYDEPDRARALVEAAARLAAEAADASLAVRARSLRALLVAHRGDLRAAAVDLASAADAARHLPPGAGKVSRYERRIDAMVQHGGLVNTLSRFGRLAEARTEAARHLADAAATHSAIADIQGGLSIVCALQGEPARSRSAYAACIVAHEALDQYPAALARRREELSLVVLPYQADDLTERTRAADAAEQAARHLLALDAQHESIDPRQARLALLALEGHWGDAHRLAAQPEAAQFARLLPFRTAILGPLARAQGEPQRAWEQVCTAWPQGPATVPGERYVVFALPLLLLGAALALDAGDVATARAWLDAHQRWLDFAGATLGRSEGEALEAAWHRAAGDPKRAHTHAERALAHATAPRQPLALLAAHRLLGSLDTEARRYGDAARHFAAALALADACRAPYERALTLLEQADLASATGDRDTATVALDEVRAICGPLGARPALARADVLAARLAAPVAMFSPVPAANPARPVPSPLPAGLSAREGEVLRLVAAGWDNATIAQHLYLSTNTIKSHVANIYGKLGVTNRAAATRAALDRGLA